MKIINSIQGLKKIRDSLKGRVGFVPTMGALHLGHLSLFEKSIQENDLTVASIFVNPTQFNDPSDLKNYPNTLNEDIKKLNNLGVDYLFTPQPEDMYPDNYAYKVCEDQFSHKLCGAHRPGHFDGVLTIVLKLFMLVKPSVAYFGEKDYQQYQLIKNMVNSFFLDIEVRGMPIVREEDGLAMSSRNELLSPEGRRVAPLIYKFLNSDHSDEEIKKRLTENGFEIDYFEEHFNRRFIAAKFEHVRLIDHVEL